MMTLFCVIVGVVGSAFPVDIDAGQAVGDLKDSIKAKKANDLKAVDADKLTLFLAKKDGGWLPSNDPDMVAMRSGAVPDEINELLNGQIDPAEEIGDIFVPAPRKKEVHVLVVVPKKDVMGKRTRVDEWFVDDVLSVQRKKRKEDEEDNGDDCTLKYFRMSGFPPLAHPMTKYTTIVARKAYAVIFAELMGKVKLCFEANSDANMIVTGNPGTGKSRFYLYCIFQIICRHQVEVQELSSFELVLNFGNTFHKYCAESKAFTELNEVDVRGLSRQRCVLRLIEGKSSQLTGWKGVSILFASPGLAGLNDYAKTNSYTYIVPAWSLDELQDYNSLVSGELKLSDDVLISRYNKFGGIPRFIFTSTEPEDNAILNRAIASYSALDIISYAKSKQPVKDGNFSHSVLEMVPTESDFRAEFHLDFLSQYIAEQIVSRVAEDSIQRVSEFAIAHADDDSGSTSVVRGKIYEMLCHKWFSLPKEHTLELRPLCSGQASPDFVIPKALPTVRFSSLDDIKVAQSWTYYRPTSKTFGALDAFILTGKQCLGLQMTLNRDHEIKAAPLNTFLKWLKGIGIATDQFYFAFVVPSNLVGSFQKQTIQTKSDSITKKPGASASVNQFVAALDVFVGDK